MCEIFLKIEETNCGIFRHGMDIKNWCQIDPHASEEEILKMKQQGRLWGCGAAFVIIDGVAKRCSYDLKNANDFQKTK